MAAPDVRAVLELQAARLTLSSNIARTYISLAQAHEAADIAKADQQRASHLLELGRQRVKAGLDNQLQIRNAETAVASAQQQAEAAQQQIDAARNALAALLGKGPDRGLDIVRRSLLAAPAPGVPSFVPSELLGHRPDVVAARWRVEAARHGIKASKAEFYPTVNLSALVGVGAASVLSPVYISEVTPAAIRGRLSTVQQIMIITGLTAAFVVNYFLAAFAGESTNSYWLGLDAWRWMYLMQAVPADRSPR